MGRSLSKHIINVNRRLNKHKQGVIGVVGMDFFTAVVCCAELVHGNVLACEDELVGDLVGRLYGGIERVDDADEGDLFADAVQRTLSSKNFSTCLTMLRGSVIPA